MPLVSGARQYDDEKSVQASRPQGKGTPPSQTQGADNQKTEQQVDEEVEHLIRVGETRSEGGEHK
jgi:hypothetical protein